MAEFISLAGLRPGMRVLDLGGTPSLWRGVPFPLEITLLNLPGELRPERDSYHELTFLEGDACDLGDLPSRDYHLVFSNSVIEHVGPPDRRKAFAREVLRIGASYWIQTPSRWFPLEAHSYMPFWWQYPDSVRRFFLRRWEEKLPAWTRMIAGTTCVDVPELRELFPGANLLVERSFGIPKSYTVYRLQPGRR